MERTGHKRIKDSNTVPGTGLDTNGSKIFSQHKGRPGRKGIKDSQLAPCTGLSIKVSKILSQHQGPNWTRRDHKFLFSIRVTNVSKILINTKDRTGKKEIKDSQSTPGTGLDAEVSKILSQHQKHDWTQNYERFLVSTRDRTGHQVIKDSQSAQWTRLDTKHQRFQST
ncbi:hypothetical protein Bbelb_277360 [Branchiostoma belcheri]|nr:hypothetical protein Bbelb_277360 [Branchiostoma belcheri]